MCGLVQLDRQSGADVCRRQFQINRRITCWNWKCGRGNDVNIVSFCRCIVNVIDDELYAGAGAVCVVAVVVVVVTVARHIVYVFIRDLVSRLRLVYLWQRVADVPSTSRTARGVVDAGVPHLGIRSWARQSRNVVYVFHCVAEDGATLEGNESSKADRWCTGRQRCRRRSALARCHLYGKRAQHRVIFYLQWHATLAVN